ncbi:bifunctional hydroxymethylpyrimidine kinase/phosphomethylpyrimidine kinase [Glycomyces sp. NPDC046736]|uniref:bifunctional hydroxymethylpyrimidine kinase/phosphomethylpyrimidine kinase n=1 Tax=Glycomyces sp. NPDC046736 TaxID=3155615 RepID=UPI00340EE9A3
MNRTQPPVALTIAGSDSGGGAGIQADLHTFAAHGVHGTSALTAITAQNTRGVTAAEAVSTDLLRAQLDAVLTDFPVAAVKTGMLGGGDLLAVVAEYGRADRLPNLVVDPVMVTTTGDTLFAGDPTAYLAELGPLATVLTPNLIEAQLLLGQPIATTDDMRDAARALATYGPRAVLVKGGHLDGEASIDVLWCDGQMLDLAAPRVATRNDHGTGCTLAAAIAARIALEHPLPQAIAGAKAYVTDALKAAAKRHLGTGPGPVHHHHGQKSTALLTRPGLAFLFSGTPKARRNANRGPPVLNPDRWIRHFTDRTRGERWSRFGWGRAKSRVSVGRVFVFGHHE